MAFRDSVKTSQRSQKSQPGVYTEGSPNASNHLWFFNTIYNTWNKTVPDDGQQEILWPAYGVLTVMDECLV
ncbi:hypothetical protein PMIN04_001403 [Paraphaeosphaeria minitans]